MALAPSPPASEDLFGGLYARGGAAAAADARAWVQAMLDVEAALARAHAARGSVPGDAAAAIAGASRAGGFDVAALARETAEHATPVIGLVAALRAAVPEDIARHVHRDATSQDVVDTAAVLVTHRALAAILADAEAAGAAAASLADAHRATPVTGRTLLQAARPTTFGLKAAGWLRGLDEAIAAVRAAAAALPAQLGGPVGTGDPELAEALAGELGLPAPVVPWHTNRVRPAALAAALGLLAGALAKVARDVVLLAQTEVAEAREGVEGRGGSSSMPHKRNPVAAVSVLACAGRVPGLVATMLAAMAQEHERAAGGWQAEWGTLTDLLRLTGSAAAWGREALEHLELDPGRMAGTLAAAGLEGGPGAAGTLIDRALAAHREARR